MSPDDAADILNDLSRKKIREILDNLKREDADSIEKLLAHDSDSAGGLMTDEFLAYKPDLTVEEAMKRFKEDAHDVETIHYIYITDELEILLGIISLRDFLLSLPQCKMSEIMATNMKTLTPEDDEDIVAATFSKYNLVAMPVVDKEGHLLGIISVDDIIDVILPPRAKRKIKKI
jgi:Mg/Co/Ni transporter MgtE